MSTFEMRDAGQRWEVPGTHPALMAGEVHVWRAALEASTEEIELLQQVLVDEELARAGRFYFAKDRKRWTIARAVLRMLLGRYLGMAPRELRFVTNAYGKPELDRASSATRLRFNLAHSEKLALYAFVWEREVGVDVEYMREGVEYMTLATRFFSAREQAELQALPEVLRKEAFFLCWSRKEAYIKARGVGLSLPLDQFDVSLTPGREAELVGSREGPGAGGCWFMFGLEPGEGYAGAVVVEGGEGGVRCWEWREGK